MSTWSNEVTSLDAATALCSHAGRHRCGASELIHLPVRKHKEMHGQTLRMSLALARNGAVFRRPARPGRRTKVRAAAHQLGPDHDGLPMGAPFRGKPGGWSRPDMRPSCKRSACCPAAHPQRWAPR